MLLQGNVRAAEMPEGEPVGAEATATDAVNVEAPGKYDEKKGDCINSADVLCG